ncbi:MAG: TRAP transporter small permease [Gammaproteobacteria bacterium]|nr:TRAP transporter small permease [Gammaproteobacteria bacterium]MDH5653624.1 TRAP transporter small permease [Gammaproteobacteria bacterium]
MDKQSGKAGQFLRYIAIIEDSILVAMLSVMILLAVMQILLRNFFQSGFTDADTLIRIMVLWVGMFGAVVASRERKQITIDVLSKYLPARVQRIIGIIVDCFVVLVCGLLAYFSTSMMLSDLEAGSSVARIPAWVVGAVLPISFGMMSLRYLLFVWLGVRQYMQGGTES